MITVLAVRRHQPAANTSHHQKQKTRPLDRLTLPVVATGDPMLSRSKSVLGVPQNNQDRCAATPGARPASSCYEWLRSLVRFSKRPNITPYNNISFRWCNGCDGLAIVTAWPNRRRSRCSGLLRSSRQIHCTLPGAPKIRNPGCSPRSSIYSDACFVYLPKLLLSELLSELFLAAAVKDIGAHGSKKLQMTPFELEPKLEGSYRKSARRPRPD
jgi:hypothetical protein